MLTAKDWGRVSSKRLDLPHGCWCQEGEGVWADEEQTLSISQHGHPNIPRVGGGALKKQGKWLWEELAANLSPGQTAQLGLSVSLSAP